MANISWLKVKGSKLLLGSFFVLWSATARADMTGYVAPGLILSNSFTESESGMRFGGHVEFARLTSYIAVDLRAMTGNNYADLGGVLKGYYPWEYNSEWTFQFGLGMGAMLSGGYDGIKRDFMDVIVHPFVGALWHWNEDFGALVNLGFDYVPHREFHRDDHRPASDGTKRTRLIFSVAFVFGA